MDQNADFLTKDFSEEITAKIPEIVDPVAKDKSGLDAALESLLSLEKKTRLAADQKSTVMLATAIVKLCKDCGAWTKINDHITLLCKRRAQLKKVVLGVVVEAIKYLDDTPSKEAKIALIETLRTVTAGKMFVELERARLTRIMAQIKEKDGDIPGAAEILQEVSVETIGSMEQREKLEIVLEQVRLCLANKDYIRSEIVAKKVTSKQLNMEELQDLKLVYYTLMIELHSHNDAYLEICKAHDAMYRTKSVQEVEAKWKASLSAAITYVALAPYDSDVAAILQRFKADEKTEQLPVFKSLLVSLTTNEIASWPLQAEADIQKVMGSRKKHLMKDFHKRVVQHNIRVISEYYKRITSKRLAELLQLDADVAEEMLSEMVSAQQLFAKIDRCAGTVTFQKKQSPALVLNAWADDVSSLLNLVDKTCHLINKENMVHGLA